MVQTVGYKNKSIYDNFAVTEKFKRILQHEEWINFNTGKEPQDQPDFYDEICDVFGESKVGKMRLQLKILTKTLKKVII